MKYTIQLVALVLGCLATSAAQTPPKERSSFCDDDAPYDLRLRQTPLPHSVLTALMNTKEAREIQPWTTGDKKSLDVAALFRGAKVSLGAAPDDTFLVIGKSPMGGADNTWFWIVRRSGEKATVLLWAGANCLDIVENSGTGLGQIVTTWSSASETVTNRYVFDGVRYKLAKQDRRPVNW